MKYTKPKINIEKLDKLDTHSKANLIISEGIAYFECDIHIVGMQLNYIGSGTIFSTLPDHWIVKQGNGIIVLIDTTGVGIKKEEIFKVDGKIELKGVLLCDTDQNVVQRVNTSDKVNHIWSKSISNEFDTNTTNWDNIKSKNIPMVTTETVKPVDPATTYDPTESGVGGGAGYAEVIKGGG